MFPLNVKAQPEKVNIEPQLVLYRPAPAVVEAVAQSQPKVTLTNYASNCVYFLQNYLYGRIGLGWGLGGRNLPLDQVPMIGSVVVFTYAHVALITQISDNKLTLIEANFVHGQITQNRQVAIGDPTIRGYYHP